MSEHGPNNDTPAAVDGRKALALGLVPAIVVVVLLIVGVVLLNPHTENSRISALDTTSSAPSAGGGAPSESGADANVQTQIDVQTQITAVMQKYVSAMNDGDAAKFTSILCKQVRASAPDFQDAQALTEMRSQLDEVSVVQVSGDSATALITASVEGAPGLGSKATPLRFIYEDGWKLC